ETRYPAAIITLNNPDHRNAMSSAMIDALMAAIARAEEDRRVRALVFTGTGAAFSAGMDLGELRTILEQTHRRFRKGLGGCTSRRGVDRARISPGQAFHSRGQWNRGWQRRRLRECLRFGRRRRHHKRL